MKANDEAILLSRIAYSETSLIVKFYTKKNGLQTYLFQGGKKKAAYLGPLTICDIEYFGRPESDLLKISKCEIKEVCHDISINVFKNSLAFFIAELLSKIIHQSEADEKLYNFLKNQINELNVSTQVAEFSNMFLIKLWNYLGITPSVESEIANDLNFMDGEFVKVYVEIDPLHKSAIEYIVSRLNEVELKANIEIRRKAFELIMEYYQVQISGIGKLKSLIVFKEVFNP